MVGRFQVGVGSGCWNRGMVLNAGGIWTICAVGMELKWDDKLVGVKVGV